MRLAINRRQYCWFQGEGKPLRQPPQRARLCPSVGQLLSLLSAWQALCPARASLIVSVCFGSDLVHNAKEGEHDRYGGIPFPITLSLLHKVHLA